MSEVKLKKDKTIGTVHPAKSLFLRKDIGDIRLNNKIVYEMSAGVMGTPILHSIKTGKWFTISWTEIIELAERAGIDKKDKR